MRGALRFDSPFLNFLDYKLMLHVDRLDLELLLLTLKVRK